ncbi:fibronectin type III domain-containing protein [Curtobacterium flaccumfaciens pv. flaccumfaciens]
MVQPGPDRSVTKRGATTTIDVLTNDQPTNPFPGERLRVVNIRGLSGGLPSGVTVTPSGDRTRLQVSVADTAKPGDAHLQYQVADATNDPDRYVWGDVTISVQDVPDAPGAPTRTGSYDGGQVTLTWSTPQGNNSPITGYRVVGTNGVSKNCGTATVCTLTGLDPKASYRFQVVATNAIGDSKPSSRSGPMSADFVPAPPKGITVTPSKATPNQLDVKWGKVSAPNNGSAVDDYIVTIEGPGLSTTRHTGTATNTSFTGAQSAAQYKVTVSARNDADRNGTVVQWNSASATGSAVGTPGKPTNLQAVAGDQADSSGRSTVTVSWSAGDAAGGSGLRYAVFRSGNVDCAAPPSNSLGSSSPTRDSGVGGGSTRYAVTVTNGYFCNVDYVDAVTYERLSGTGRPSVDVVPAGTNLWNVSVTASSRPAHHYQLEAGGQPITLQPGQTWTGVPGSGARNVSAPLTVRACGGPGSSFCSSDADSWTGNATALDANLSVATAQQGQPIAVTGPSGSGITVRYTAYWYASDDGNGFPTTSSWDAGGTPPEPPFFAKSVKVRAYVTATDGSGSTQAGEATDAFPVAAAPEPEQPAPEQPAPEPAPGG